MDRQTDSPMQEYSPPGGRRSFHRCGLLVGAALFAGTLLPGCQIVVGTLLTLQGRPKTTCEFTNMTKKNLAEKGKKVIILSSSAASAQWEEPSLDLDIIDAVSRRLQIENVDVVDPHKVGTWIDDNGGIKETTNLDPIGVKFKADYIILIKFNNFGYGEQNSPNFYRGHASYKVVVVEMVKDENAPGGKRAKMLYSHAFESKYPANRPVAVEEVTPELFKSKYMANLAQELARKFVDYRPEDEMN
jgi:hypothetical protein